MFLLCNDVGYGKLGSCRIGGGIAFQRDSDMKGLWAGTASGICDYVLSRGCEDYEGHELARTKVYKYRQTVVRNEVIRHDYGREPGLLLDCCGSRWPRGSEVVVRG